MSDSTDSAAVPSATRRFGIDALVTGLSLSAATLFGIMWWYARQQVSGLEERVARLQEQVAPLRQEAERYRAGLLQEVNRNHQLSEELKAAQTKTASTK